MQTLIQYASDIHLEHESGDKIEFRDIIAPRNGAEILILAGDISNPRLKRFEKFIKWCCQNWKWVIMIAGNHEYYGNSILETNKYIKEMSEKVGFHFLINESVRIPRELGKDIVVLGSTLWSYIPEKSWMQLINYLNDFHLIGEYKTDYRRYNSNYSLCRKFLKEMLKRYDDCVKVVVTHHAPIEDITSAPIFRGKITSKGFASNCDELLKLADVWIFDHTHFNPYPIIREKCLVVSNQRGYRGNCKNYRKQACVNV